LPALPRILDWQKVNTEQTDCFLLSLPLIARVWSEKAKRYHGNARTEAIIHECVCVSTKKVSPRIPRAVNLSTFGRQKRGWQIQKKKWKGLQKRSHFCSPFFLKQLTIQSSLPQKNLTQPKKSTQGAASHRKTRCSFRLQSCSAKSVKSAIFFGGGGAIITGAHEPMKVRIAVVAELGSSSPCLARTNGTRRDKATDKWRLNQSPTCKSAG